MFGGMSEGSKLHWYNKKSEETLHSKKLIFTHCNSAVPRHFAIAVNIAKYAQCKKSIVIKITVFLGFFSHFVTDYATLLYFSEHFHFINMSVVQ